MLVVFGRIILYGWKLWKIYNSSNLNIKEIRGKEEEEEDQTVEHTEQQDKVRKRTKKQIEVILKKKEDNVEYLEHDHQYWKEIVDFETKWMM